MSFILLSTLTNLVRLLLLSQPLISGKKLYIYLLFFTLILLISYENLGNSSYSSSLSSFITKIGIKKPFSRDILKTNKGKLCEINSHRAILTFIYPVQ